MRITQIREQIIEDVITRVRIEKGLKNNRNLSYTHFKFIIKEVCKEYNYKHPNQIKTIMGY